MIEMGEKEHNINESIFKSIYTDSPIGIELYDSNGKLIDLNQSCMELFGVSIKEDIKGFDLLNDPNIPKEHLTKLKQRETVRFESSFDFDLVKKQKLYETIKTGKIYIDVLITPLFLEDNKSLSNYLIQIQDITDQKRAEHKLIELNEEFKNIIQERTIELKKSKVNWQILVEEAPDIIFTVDCNGRILYINQVTAGITQKEAIGTDVLDYVSPEFHDVVRNSIERVFQTGEPDYYEISARGPNDGVSWYSTRLGAMKQDEKVISVMLIKRDITERKKTEHALRESKEQYKNVNNELETVLDIIPGMLFCKDRNGVVTRTNQVFAESLNLKKEDIIGKTAFDLFPKDQAEAFQRDDLKVISSGKPKLNIEESADFSDGTIWAITNKIPYYNKEGEINGIIGLSVDITERKKIEQELKESEEKFRTITEQSLMGIAILQDDRFRYVNKQIADIFGYSPEEMKNWERFEYAKLIHPGDRDMALEQARKKQLGLPEAIIHYQFRGITKEGMVKWVEIYSNSIKYRHGIADLITIIDISGKREVEQKLLASEEKYRTLIDNIVDIIFEIDFDGKITYLSSQSFDMLGYKPEEMINQNAFRFIHPDDQEKVLKNHNYVINTGEVGSVEFRIRHKKDHYIIVSSRSQLIEKENKKKIVGLFRDITERKKIKERLQEEKGRVEMYLNLVNVIIVALDQNGNISMINKKGNDILGWSEGDLIGKNWFENCLPSQDREKVSDYFKKLMKDEIDVIPFYENSVLPKTGDEKLIAWSTILIKDSEGNLMGVLSSGEDITERKKAEKKLKKSEQELIRKNMEINTIFDTIPAMLNVVDKEYNVINISDAFAKKFHNGKKENAIGKKCYQAHKNCDEICSECSVKRAIESGKIETRISTPEEEARLGKVFKIYAAPLKDVNGIITGTVEAIMDITDIKKAEERIRGSEKKLMDLIESVPVGISITTPEGKTLVINSQAFQIFGYSSKEEFLSIPVINLYHNPSARERLLKLHDKGLVKDFEIKFKRKDGSVFWGSLTSVAHNEGDQTTFINSFQDITDRKITEIKIQQSEAELSAIYNYTPIAILLLDNERRIRKINKFALKFTDRREEDVFGILGGEALRCLYSIKDPRGCGFSEHCQKCIIRNTVLDTFKSKSPHINVEATLFLLPGSVADRVHLLFSTIPLKLDGEDRVLVSMIDITERIKAKQELKESEERFKYLVSSSPSLIYTSKISCDYGATFISDNVQKKWGYSSEDFINNSDFWLNRVHPDDKEEVLSILSNLFEKEHVIYDYRFKLNDGNYRWMRDEVELVKDKEGNPIETIGSVIDINDRKEVEQSLEESEKRYKHLANELEMILDHLPGVIVYKDTENNILRVNKYMADAHNLKKGDMEGKSSFEFYPYEEAQAYWEDDLEVVENKKTKFDIIEPWETLEGRRWVNTSKIPYIDKDGNVKGIIAMAFDITDRIKAKEELKESEEKYRNLSNQYKMLLESITDGVFALNRDWEYILVNKNAEVLVNMPIEKLLGHKIFEVFPGIEQTPFFKVYKKVMNTEEAERVINSFTLPDSHIGYYEVSVYPIKEGILCIGKDVTEEKQIEQKLKESEEKFRNIAQQTSLGLMIQQEGLIKFANSAMANISEYSIQEINNWSVEDMIEIIHKEDKPFIHAMVKILRSDDFDTSEQFECRMITKSGSIKWLEFIGKPIIYLGKKAVFASVIDITAKKKLEEELKEISRLKSELLSRTSHELKTPLVSIKGYADLLLSQHYEMLDIYTVSVLNEIKQGCYRLESLIKDLLETSMLESDEIQLNKSEDDLAFLIRFCIRDLKGLIERRNHELILDIQDTMMMIFEKERIYEVIMNILSNAIKYTPLNGQISIKSEIKDNNYIISVKDNGIGLSKDEQDKIFKKFGKIERYGKGMDVVSEGSGLGLYISKKIIELHGGEIWVESKGRDKGSTFYFSLPMIKK